MNPNYATAHNNRGLCWQDRKQFDKALAAYTAALALDETPWTYQNRGLLHSQVGQYQNALADFESAIRLDPEYAAAWNGRSWMRSTCPDPAFRDAQQSLSDAIKACELTEYKVASYLDTLAAAYAEAGDFPKALAEQQKAIDLAPEKEKPDYLTRLALFQNGQPYREPPVGTLTSPPAAEMPK